jgi:hypothetical protein
MTRRALHVAVALAAIGEIAACGCPDDGAIVSFTGTEALTPTQGISALDYLVVASPAPSCASAIAAFQAGETPPGTVYEGFQPIAPEYLPNAFILVPPPARKNGCRAGSATGTFVALLYDSADFPCIQTGCPQPAPALLATACAEDVTIYADRKIYLELPVEPVP